MIIVEADGRVLTFKKKKKKRKRKYELLEAEC